MNDKPECKLIGEDGNAFIVIGRVKETLVRSGKPKLAKEFTQKAIRSHSYDAVLALASDYVEII